LGARSRLLDPGKGAGELRGQKDAQAESDVLWRLRWRGGDRWLYVYLLLEFQSTVDPFMAVRMMTYLGLLYEDLIRRGHLTPDGLLPPVLPLVLYNGLARWEGAQDVSDLIEVVPGGLEQYRPQLRYCLLDEGRIAVSDLEPLQNLAAALFRLERSRGPEDVQRVLEALLTWLAVPALSELRRSFGVWMREVLLPARVPGAVIPQVADLEEVKSMLAERVVEWTREWEQEGFEKGLQQGIAQEAEKTVGVLRGMLLASLEERFGALPEAVRRQVNSVGSVEELANLFAQSRTASSLASLGLVKD
jgi:putative YhgA-like transposase